MARPSVSYAIATTPRSGSNLLCDLLEMSDVMGAPREFLNITGFMVPFAQEYGLIREDSTIDCQEYLDQVVEAFASDNSVFGMKLVFDQLEFLFSLRAVRDFMKGMKFVWLVRKDVISQAVSLHIARETNEWDSFDEETHREKLGRSLRDKVEYDPFKIARYVEDIERQNKKWSEFFEVNEVTPLTITYEELIGSGEKVCNDILGFCSVAAVSITSIDESKYKRQSDDLNEIFCDRFRTERDVLSLDGTYSAREVVEEGGVRLLGGAQDTR